MNLLPVVEEDTLQDVELRAVLEASDAGHGHVVDEHVACGDTNSPVSVLPPCWVYIIGVDLIGRHVKKKSSNINLLLRIPVFY